MCVCWGGGGGSALSSPYFMAKPKLSVFLNGHSSGHFFWTKNFQTNVKCYRFTTMLAKSNIWIFLGGGENSGHFPPPQKKVSTILAVFVIQGYKFFWRNKSKFVGQKKIFFDGKPKMTKKSGFENLEIPKMGQI